MDGSQDLLPKRTGSKVSQEEGTEVQRGKGLTRVTYEIHKLEIWATL